jgi:hypothetical protein
MEFDERIEPDEGRNVSQDWRDVMNSLAQEDYEQELITTGIEEQSEDRATSYLATFGDSAWHRIKLAVDEARSLLVDGHTGASLAFSAIAAELSIRFLLVRPLLGAIIFSDAIAERVSEEAVTGRTTLDRQILPLICQHWGVDANALRLADGTPLIPYLTTTLWTQRNHLRHRGARINLREAELAEEAVRLMIDGLVGPVVRRLQLAWPPGAWATRPEDARSPFKSSPRQHL